MLRVLLGLAALLASPPLYAQVVSTSLGPVFGTRGVQVEAGAYESFLGIPYAQSPTGALRLAPPQPLTRFPHGFVRGDTAGPWCVQKAPLGEMIGKEDCLYLNIWRPLVRRAAPLPVMVFIHGGGNIEGAGSTSIYDGARLSLHGQVIVVTINYRLGNLGFLAHAALSAANGEAGFGNYGILDQLEALRWVNKHISNFGGDPANVTIFGESAGANGVVTLMASAKARPYFRRGIAESSPSGIYTRDEARVIGNDLATKLCGAAIAKVPALLVACLRTLPPQRFLAVQAPMIQADPDTNLDMNARPNVDGVLLTTTPRAALAAVTGKELIIGSNLEESKLFIPALIPLSALERSLAIIFGQDLEAMLARYNLPSRDEQVKALVTDVSYTCVAKGFALAMARQNPHVYSFQFTHRAVTPVSAVIPPTHAMELAAVFGLYAAWPGLGGGDNLPVQHAMQTAWTNFAHSGDPNVGPRRLPFVWPRFEALGRQTQVFGRELPAHPLFGLKADLAASVCERLPGNH